MLGSDGVFDVLSDQARVQCVSFTREQGTRNIPAERFAGSGGHHLARHGRGWKGCSQAGGQCTMVFKEENSEFCNWRAAKEVVNTALRKGSRLVLSWCPYSLGAGYQTDVTLLSGIPPELLKRMFQVKGIFSFKLAAISCCKLVAAASGWLWH